jgi:acyl carrier protein
MPPELRQILTNVLQVKSISEQDSAETVATWDSVRHLTLMTAIEERFDVIFSADQMMDLTSVSAIVDALGQRGPS